MTSLFSMFASNLIHERIELYEMHLGNRFFSLIKIYPCEKHKDNYRTNEN